MQNIHKQRSHSSNSITQEHSRLENNAQIQRVCFESGQTYDMAPASRQQQSKRATKNQIFWKRMRSLKMKHLCKMCNFNHLSFINNRRIEINKWANWVVMNVAIRYNILHPFSQTPETRECLKQQETQQNAQQQYEQQQSLQQLNDYCQRKSSDQASSLLTLQYFDLQESQKKLGECADYYKYLQCVPLLPDDATLGLENQFRSERAFIIVQQYMNLRKAMYYSNIRQVLMKDMSSNSEESQSCKPKQNISDDEEAFNYLQRSFSQQKSQKVSAIHNEINETILLIESIQEAGEKNWYTSDQRKQSVPNSARCRYRAQKMSNNQVISSSKKNQSDKQKQMIRHPQILLKSILSKSRKISKSKASEPSCKKNYDSNQCKFESKKSKPKQSKKKRRKELKKFSSSCENLLGTNKKRQDQISRSHKKTTQTSQILDRQHRYCENQLGNYSESILKQYISELKQKINREKLNLNCSVQLAEQSRNIEAVSTTKTITKAVKDSITQAGLMSKKKSRKKSIESNSNLITTKSDKFYVAGKQKFHEGSQAIQHRKSNRKICATKAIKQEVSSNSKQTTKIKVGSVKGGPSIKSIKK